MICRAGMRHCLIHARQWFDALRSADRDWRNPSSGSYDDQSRLLTEKKMPGGSPALHENLLARTTTLLHFVAWAEVAGVERLAAGKAFVLAMIKGDAVFAEFPAEGKILIVDNRGKIGETAVQILQGTAGFKNAVDRKLERLRGLAVLGAGLGQVFHR